MKVPTPQEILKDKGFSVLCSKLRIKPTLKLAQQFVLGQKPFNKFKIRGFDNESER